MKMNNNNTLPRLLRSWNLMTREKIAYHHSTTRLVSPTTISSYSTTIEKVPIHASTPTTLPGQYKSSLPLPAISLYSKEGKRLFDEAWKAGTAAGFMEIATNLSSQARFISCGLASLSTILNALLIDPQRVWKSNWRWYDENMLADKEKMRQIETNRGMSIKNLIDLVPKDKVKLQAVYATESSLQEFREHLLSSCSSDSSYVDACYSRRALNQAGKGHSSPIGAYVPSADVVLIMDVARYKYPPYWVPCSKLWDAMSAGGFLVISKP